MTRSCAPLVLLGALLATQAAVAQNFVAPQHEPWGKRADNRIWAQKVVDDLMAANPDLVAIGLHAVPPGVSAQSGEPGQVIVAQVEDIIGKPDSPGDLEVSKNGITKIYKGTLKGVGCMRVLTPLLDGAGRNIGLAIFSFKLGNKVTPLSAHGRAVALLRQMAQRFPDRTSLFRATS